MTKPAVILKAELGAIIVRPVLLLAVWVPAGVPLWEKNARLMMSRLVKRKVASGAHLRMEDLVGAVIHQEVVL